ncbi:MAG: TRAP transporter small permease [Pseudomonadota bacterium]
MIKNIATHIEEGIVSILLVSMTLLVFFDVLLRFAFDTGFIWVEELTLTLNAWFVLFGMSYGVKVGAHIGVDTFVKKLPPNIRKVTALIAITICLTYCVFFLYGSWVYLAKMYSIGITMDDISLPQFIVSLVSEDTLWKIFKVDGEDLLVPIWMSQSILLFGFSLLMLRFLQLFISVLKNHSLGFKFSDEAEDSMHLVQKDEASNIEQPTNKEQGNVK